MKIYKRYKRVKCTKGEKHKLKIFHINTQPFQKSICSKLHQNGKLYFRGWGVQNKMRGVDFVCENEIVFIIDPNRLCGF